MAQSANPLKQYFRQPAIYLRLPSGGEYWPPGSLDMPQNGELPVYPMTAIDEITYRTPDALFNGSAVTAVIQSCVPNIKDAWAAPAIDINAILVAIRIASFGHEMELSSDCPSCGTNGEFGVDLRVLLDRTGRANYGETFKHGDLEVTFQPIDYREANRTSQQQFEYQRTIQSVAQSELADEEKVKQLNSALQQITALTVTALTASISSIRTPTATVTERTHIEEFVNHCDRNLFNRMRDAVVALRQATDLPPIDIECDNCHHKYKSNINMDQASFFEPAS
jgi:hypothetical protein